MVDFITIKNSIYISVLSLFEDKNIRDLVTVEETKKDLGDGATVLKIDIDKNNDIAVKYGIRSIPTLLIFKEGKVVWRQSGVPPKNLIVESVKKFI